MSKLTKRTTSQLRLETVGSYLRPKELKEARSKFSASEISREDLTKTEDRFIIDLIKKEAVAGVIAVTDGEFRRS